MKQNWKDIFIEWLAVLYLYSILLISSYIFITNSGGVNIIKYIKATGINLDSQSYGYLSLLTAVIVPFVILLRKYSVHLRRSFYVICGLPFASFLTPYGIWLNLQFGINFTVLIDLSFYFSLLVIAGGCFREVTK